MQCFTAINVTIRHTSIRWLRAVSQLEANPIYLDLGTGSSPALAGNLLVIVSDNEKQQYIAAFDKQTGKRVWRTNRDLGGKGEPVQRSGWATPFVWRHALRTEIVAVGPGEVVSYDLAGKELWRMSGMTATPEKTRTVRQSQTRLTVEASESSDP